MTWQNTQMSIKHRTVPIFFFLQVKDPEQGRYVFPTDHSITTKLFQKSQRWFDILSGTPKGKDHPRNDAKYYLGGGPFPGQAWHPHGSGLLVGVALVYMFSKPLCHYWSIKQKYPANTSITVRNYYYCIQIHDKTEKQSNTEDPIGQSHL